MELTQRTESLHAKLTRTLWQPKSPPKLTIDPDLVKLPWQVRSAEVIRYFLLSVEHWISPSGWLREWIRLNVRIAVTVAATALLVVPAVSALLTGLADWTFYAEEAVGNTVSAAMKLPPVILGVIALVIAIRWLRTRQPGRAQRQYRDEYDPYR